MTLSCVFVFVLQRGEEMIAARYLVLAVMAVATVSGEESLNDRLILAARQGNLSAVRSLIERGAELNAQSAEGNTALIQAVHARNADVVKWLLSKGADVNRKTNVGFTALMAAAYMKQQGIVDMLLARNAEVDAQKADTGMTPLMFAAHEGDAGIVKSLLARGANVRLKNNEGKTALALAEDAQAIDAVKLLAERPTR
jgi:ankyrin repeat protein